MKPQFTLTEKGLSINSFARPLSVFDEKNRTVYVRGG
jgi:hypothetical protein